MVVRKMSASKSSLERMLDVLLVFADSGGEHSFDEMLELSSVSRSTAYRYLQILRDYELVEDGLSAGFYRLGPSITRLARSQTHEKEFVKRARPIMQSLASQTGETTMLARRSSDRIVVIDSVNSEKSLRVNIDAADNLPINRGSFGKLYLALQYKALKANPGASRRIKDLISDNGTFGDELKAIRGRNYAISSEEVEDGAASISVPVFSTKNQMFAALTVAGPAVRLTSAKMKAFLPLLTKASRSISLLLSSDRMSAQLPKRKK
jgi:IclR family KDG regulon transcriptional repressor